MRVKIENKQIIPFNRTVVGLKTLMEKIKEHNIPDNATVYWREWNVAEFLWSADDGISGPRSKG